MRLALTIAVIGLVACGRSRPADGPAIAVYAPAATAPAARGAPASFGNPALEPALTPATPRGPADQVGRASYYADSLAGNATASGERYEPMGLTAAHRELPFGTVVDVRRRDTGAMVRVRINDRGPFAGNGRIIDLSRRAAEALDMLRAGVIDVDIHIVEKPR
jgi:rare lipoprotein A